MKQMNKTVQDIIANCREAGLRRTKALEELISTLLESVRPMTLAELATSPRLSSQCDKATVFSPAATPCRTRHRSPPRPSRTRCLLRAADPRKTQRLFDLYLMRYDRTGQSPLPSPRTRRRNPQDNRIQKPLSRTRVFRRLPEMRVKQASR